MGLFSFLKKTKNNSISENKTHDIVKQEQTIDCSTELMVKGLTIHSDIRNLVWIADGKYKNYEQTENKENVVIADGIRITISFQNQEEPSLIYTNQKIEQPKNIEDVERPPYFPTYSGLTPEQKWIYLNFLTNPYDPSINIGYVFILYYGLERHLLNGNFDEAINVIIKLRDVHSNGSFQAYSANAVILSCMLHERGDLVLEFLKSLDKDYEFNFSDCLFLMCFFSFNIPITPNDVMRMAKTFEFTNINYIKKYPELFLECLESVVEKKLGTKAIDLKNYFTATELKKIKKTDVNIFANMSILDKTISIPLLSDSFKLKREMYNFLEVAHNSVKEKLVEMRKSGITLPSKTTNTIPKKTLVFDEKNEKVLLKELAENKNDLVNRHFNFIRLQDFYYRYRSLGDEYLNECIKYCELDIDSLPEMVEQYVAEEIKNAKEYPRYLGKEKLTEKIEEIKANGFVGNIPAFGRLAIIYEKQKNYIKAIEICDKAITYYKGDESFETRKQKLEKKLNKA